MQQKAGARANEEGFAALVIAVVLVTVMGLLVVGFGQLSRNTLNQSTDRQESQQAYYAAESGINDAVRAISDGFTSQKTTCGPLPAGPNGQTDLSSNVIDSSTGTRWTCLLINTSPTSLVYGSIDTETPTVFSATAVDASGTPTDVSSITISWQDADPSQKTFKSNGGVDTNQSFPPLASWGATGILRAAITPIPTDDLSRQSLTDNTYTAFLYPSTKGPNTDTVAAQGPDSGSTAANQGDIVNGACSTTNTPRYCSVTINNINASAGQQILFNLRSIYSKTSVYITGTSAAGNPVSFVDAQAVVDSTGKSQDVLKRLQVRISEQNDYDYPGFDVSSLSGLCKQISGYPSDLPTHPGYASGCGY